MSKRKILITGKGSYVGTSFMKWVEQWPDQYEVVELSVRGTEWKEHDFSIYDVVLHVAGIAHRKETKENVNLYYKVNRDLAFEVANKAKSNGVKQFIFLSSMSVYGIETGVIDSKSSFNPKSNYGKSKLEAENLIMPLSSSSFRIAILRPPMIYGKGCKGNYPRLARLALNVPLFPDIENNRSVIFVENLCEFLRLLIDDCNSGYYFPQNEEYMSTSEVVEQIAEVHKRKIRKTKIFNPLLNLLKTSSVNKVFGNLVYERRMSEYRRKYCISGFKDSIFLTEKGH